MPFGVAQGNVFHNNNGFGWYVDKMWVTSVMTDDDGYVADWDTCTLWNMDTGEDQSRGFVVRDHVEYFEDFSFGAYELGDVTFENTISALNNNGLYWKTYRRGPNSGPLCRNCTFYQNNIPVRCIFCIQEDVPSVFLWKMFRCFSANV